MPKQKSKKRVTWQQSCGGLTPEDLVPPLPPGASEGARLSPLFDWYGNLGRQAPEWFLNRWVPLPLHIYDGDLTMIVGHASPRANAPNQVLVKTDANGSDRGIVLLWVGHYTDTSIGPYDSVWASVVTRPAGAGPGLENPLAGRENHGSNGRFSNVLADPSLLALPILQPEQYRFASVFWRVSRKLPQKILQDVFKIPNVYLGSIDVAIETRGNHRFLEFLCTGSRGGVLAQGRVRHDDDDREVAFQFAPVGDLLGWEITRDLIVQNMQQRPHLGTLVADDPEGTEQAILYANFLPFLRLWEWHPLSGDQIRLDPELQLDFVPVLYFRARGFKGVLRRPIKKSEEETDDDLSALVTAASVTSEKPPT